MLEGIKLLMQLINEETVFARPVASATFKFRRAKKRKLADVLSAWRCKYLIKSKAR